MTHPPPTILIIQPNICFQIDQIRLEIKTHLGLFADVHFFEVKIYQQESEKPGLLRVGSVDGNLNLELQLRQALGNHKMVAELLISAVEDAVLINLLSTPTIEELTPESASNLQTAQDLEEEFAQLTPESASNVQISEYLEEEFEEPEVLTEESNLPSNKILLLSYLPDSEITLSTWLKQEHSLVTSLSLASQICQFFRYVHQQGWCFVQIVPTLIQIGTPIQFFDLTGIQVIGEKLNYGLTGDYCAPELALGYPVDEQVSSYIVGTLLYQSIYHQLPNLDDIRQLETQPIPRIYQIIKICLAPSGDRFSLSQLLSLLIETRNLYSQHQIRWDVASRSTVGLSMNRLQNEDNYGVKQNYSYQSEPLILGIVADGMGGMAQGEIASSLAVKTVLEEPLPPNLKTVENRAQWLTTLVQKANDCVVQNVHNGGTTLSLILAVGRELMIAHVGDSRIFLLRNGCICQLSDDHSLVAMLLASGEITYQESQDHPERSVLLRSIGTKRKLDNEYIQDLSRFGSGLSMSLENEDILILCSDGIWDLVPMDELAEIFVSNPTMQTAVDQTINQVIMRGANDNATILALQCFIEQNHK